MPVLPITTHNFVLRIPDIDTIGAFSQCSGLELSYEIFEYREGGNNEVVHRLPGRLQYPNLMLSRGLTNEDALLKWFSATATEAQRKEVTLTMSQGDAQRRWTFAEAYPIRWTGPTIDANGASIASESLEIAHGGLKAA